MVCVGWTLIGTSAVAAVAQDGESPKVDRAAVLGPGMAEVPFAPGEQLTYRVVLGVAPVGTGFMQVHGIDTVRGRPSYHLSMGLDASHLLGLLTVRDRYESWLDAKMLVSRRFIRDVDQPRYADRRVFEIYPEEKRWERVDEEKSGESPSMLALDEISFLYFLRTLPLEVGAEYSFERYFKEEGNPVTVRVLRRERIEVPAGTFDALVVQPIIRTRGLFSEGGEAEVYLSDDEHRHLVYLRSSVPIVGSLSLHLESIQVGSWN